jgi:hypothetical protein
MANFSKKNKTKIDKIQICNDIITGRGGLFLFVRYITKIGILRIMENTFGFIRKSRKGKKVSNIFKQLFCYFLDGTELTLARFSRLMADKGYAAIIENNIDEMISTDSIKRFFQSFTVMRIWLFRKILLTLFVWRLKIEKPDIIKIGIDTMVLDNDEALKKQGVEPTYKKVKGFQPLQITWKNYLIDAIFRSGKKHSNYSDHVVKMIRTVLKRIRNGYSKDVPVLVRMDTGFFDEKNFQEFEKMGIAYICGGKLYSDIKEYIDGIDPEIFNSYENNDNIWDYVEFGDKRGTWSKFRRAVYASPRKEGDQLLLEFARPDTIIYTNIGHDIEITEKIKKVCGEECIQAWWCLKEYHARGADELVHKGLKDLGTEQMPFYQFNANAVFYYTMVIAFNLFECYKYDVTNSVVPLKSLAKTLRRLIVDFAAKVVIHAGNVIVKVSKHLSENINIQEMWLKCNNPVAIIFSG